MGNSLLARFASVEAKFDTILFRRPDEEPDSSADAPKRTSLLRPAIAGTIATGIYGANKAANAMAPQIQDRLKGLRMTSGHAGFRDRSKLAQEVVATADVFKERPLQAIKAGAKGIGQDVAGLYRKAAPVAGDLLKKGRAMAGSLIRASAKPTPGERLIAMAAKFDA